MKRPVDKDIKSAADSFIKEVGAKCTKIDFNNFFIYGAIVLAVGAGFYALLSPNARNARLANPSEPKILVAADGPSLRANVAPTLSSAKYFLMIQPASSKIIEVSKNPFITSQVVHGADIAYFVAGKGEEAVIAGDIGPQCYQVLSHYGIRAYGGYSGKVKDVVALYQDGRNSPAPMMVPPHGFGQGLGMAAPVGFTTPFFSCPRCQWRVHAAATPDLKIKCPNCGFTGTQADGFVQMPLVQCPAPGALAPAAVVGPFQAPMMRQAAVGAYAGGALNASPAYPYRRYAQGVANNPQCVLAPAPAQQAAWGNGYGAGTGAGGGRRRTVNSPYTWQ